MQFLDYRLCCCSDNLLLCMSISNFSGYFLYRVVKGIRVILLFINVLNMIMCLIMVILFVAVIFMFMHCDVPFFWKLMTFVFMLFLKIFDSVCQNLLLLFVSQVLSFIRYKLNLTKHIIKLFFFIFFGWSRWAAWIGTLSIIRSHWSLLA